MDEEKIVAQAKVKKTLGIITKVFMAAVLIVLVAGAVLLICAESGVAFAQQAIAWLQEKFGIVLGAAALGSMLILLKALISIYNTANSNESKSETVLAETIEAKNEAAKASEAAKTAAAIVEQAATSITERNDAIDTLSEQQGVLFETMKLFVTANTNDATIKSIFKKFEETQLFNKAKTYYDTAAETTTEKVASAKEIIEATKAASSAAQVVIPTVVETVRTILKK